MSVDWYTCKICGKSFNDCGPHFNCCNCEEYLCKSCGDKQIKKYGASEEGSKEAEGWGEGQPVKCQLCDKMIPNDEAIIDWLLSETGQTKEDVINKIKDSL